MTEPDIHRIYLEERARFLPHYPELHRVLLVLQPHHFLPRAECTSRDLAWYDPNTRTIHLVRANALTRRAATLRAVFRHELGHAADGELDQPGAEARADAIAEQVTGEPIRYTRGEDLQHLHRGRRKRPGWLPT